MGGAVLREFQSVFGSSAIEGACLWDHPEQAKFENLKERLEFVPNN
jgi:hypothetical protein